MNTLILSCMTLYRGEHFDLPPKGPFRILHPRKFLLDNPGDVLIYHRGRQGIWETPGTKEGYKHAILLNHGRVDLSTDEFLAQYGEGLIVNFRGTIKIQDNCPRITGAEYGCYVKTTRFAFWDYPPYQNDNMYVAESESPWADAQVIRDM